MVMGWTLNDAASPRLKTMTRILFLALLAGLALAFTVQVSAAESGSKARGRLVHMVSFKFKDTATAADIRKVEEAFAALPGKIPQIASYETGTNVSPEKLDKGFTHAFLLTFRSAKDRDDYLVHPDHKAFGSIVGPHVADVFVIDFWTDKPHGKGAAKGEAKKEKHEKKEKSAKP